MKEEVRDEFAHKRHMKKMWRAIYVLVALAAVLGVYIYVSNLPPPVGMYDQFAQCIASSGATFYGAFWCPHCQQQKANFGDSVHYLPYVECSTPDATGQTQVCIAKGIHEYPTWYFANDASSTGVQTMAQLSQETGCPLPSSTQ
jgi:hypothetical protein